ncbi:MAG: type I restriction enzyme HsdR N-terminal domain-containing protein, partial [Anaerolineae bacterium]|nr:type I restriction enzyme HsdR N-terminal domain-containing protein [Anaerolineae bacterium]
MRLFDALSQISEQIKQHRELMNKSEATVEQVSVLPFVDALGYDTKKPAEVRRQYPILNMDAVDFAILRDGEPIMFLEAKKADENLNAKHWKQLFQYFNADKARIGILTNGVDYRFYSDIVKPNIM